MRPRINRVSPVLVLLATSVGLLALAQSLYAFETIASRGPALVNLEYWPATHTREEVGASAVDLSADGHHENDDVIPDPARLSSPRESAAEVEVATSPPHRMTHRRVSPRSPDDAFPSA